MKKLLLIILLCALLLPFACERFEDGPLISFRSVNNRITGTWNVDKFYIDGADSTEEYLSKLGCEIIFYNDDYYSGFKNIYLRNCKDNSGLTGYWNYFHRGNRLMVLFPETNYFINPIGPFGSHQRCDWTVLRITNTNLKLTASNWQDYRTGKTSTFLIYLKKDL